MLSENTPLIPELKWKVLWWSERTIQSQIYKIKVLCHEKLVGKIKNFLMQNGKTPSVAEKAENCLGRTLRKPPSEGAFGRTLRKDLKRSSGSVPSEGPFGRTRVLVTRSL